MISDEKGARAARTIMFSSLSVTYGWKLQSARERERESQGGISWVTAISRNMPASLLRIRHSEAEKQRGKILEKRATLPLPPNGRTDGWRMPDVA